MYHVQCVAVCCSVLQIVADRHGVMTHSCAKYNVLHCVEDCCIVLKIVAERHDVMTHLCAKYSVLRGVASCCREA